MSVNGKNDFIVAVYNNIIISVFVFSSVQKPIEHSIHELIFLLGVVCCRL